MEKPNKIFMPNELLSEEWQKHIEGEDTEYIRKDTILSLLNQKRCSCSGMPPTQFFQGEMCGLQEAIQIVKGF